MFYSLSDFHVSNINQFTFAHISMICVNFLYSHKCALVLFCQKNGVELLDGHRLDSHVVLFDASVLLLLLTKESNINKHTGSTLIHMYTLMSNHLLMLGSVGRYLSLYCML